MLLENLNIKITVSHLGADIDPTPDNGKASDSLSGEKAGLVSISDFCLCGGIFRLEFCLR